MLHRHSDHINNAGVFVNLALAAFNPNRSAARMWSTASRSPESPKGSKTHAFQKCDPEICGPTTPKTRSRPIVPTGVHTCQAPPPPPSTLQTAILIERSQIAFIGGNRFSKCLGAEQSSELKRGHWGEMASRGASADRSLTARAPLEREQIRRDTPETYEGQTCDERSREQLPRRRLTDLAREQRSYLIVNTWNSRPPSGAREVGVLIASWSAPAATEVAITGHASCPSSFRFIALILGVAVPCSD
jgi:hypothetical protein